KNCSLGLTTSRRERTWRLKGRNLALSKFVRPNGTCVTNAIMRPKKNRESRVQSAYSPDEIIAVVSARDARRIWRRSLPTCGRGIPYRAILPRRVSLHRRFASAQRQTLLSVGYAGNLRPPHFERVRLR